MGTVHKFRPPPKNEKQFRGYRPQGPVTPGSGKPARRGLRGWQRSVLTWTALVLLATGIWAVRGLIA